MQTTTTLAKPRLLARSLVRHIALGVPTRVLFPTATSRVGIDVAASVAAFHALAVAGIQAVYPAARVDVNTTGWAYGTEACDGHGRPLPQVVAHVDFVLKNIRVHNRTTWVKRAR